MRDGVEMRKTSGLIGEPCMEELLNDDMVQLVMRRDRLDREQTKGWLRQLAAHYGSQEKA